MRSSWFVAVVATAGCATATSPQNNENSDAHQPIDAPLPGTDGRPADGAIHDAPITQHDAPSGSCATPTAGVLASWSFTGAPGSQASTPSSSTATGITAGAVTRAGVTATAAANSINSNNWPTAATLDPTKYYTLSITPPAGCLLDLTAMSVDGLASSSGPNTAKVGTSADSFAATTGVAVTTASTPALSVSGASGMIEIRIFGYGAMGSSGTFRLQNTLTVSGSLH